MEKRTDMVNFHFFYLIGFVSVIKATTTTKKKAQQHQTKAVILRNCFNGRITLKNTVLLEKVKGRNNRY